MTARRSYTQKPELMWKVDAGVEQARKLPDWGTFHRVCGRQMLFFDHIERDGKRGPYTATAFTLRGREGNRVTTHLADGTGATVLDALFAAFRASGVAVPDAEPLIARELGGGPVEDEFEALLPAAVTPVPVDEFEELLG